MRSGPSRLRLVGLALAASAVLIGLYRGGVDALPQLCVSTLTCCAAALCARRKMPMPPIVVAGSVALGWTLFQLVPLPPAVFAVSPAARDVFEASLAPIGLWPTPRPLSLDPAATAQAVLKGAGVLAALTVSIACSRSNDLRLSLVQLVALAGALAAVDGLSGGLASQGVLLRPTFGLVNPNHLAGLLNLSGLAALGLAMHRDSRLPLLWWIVFAACALVSFLTLSRGGILSLSAGLAVFGVLMLRGRRRSPGDGELRDRGPTRLVIVGVVVSVAFALAAPRPVSSELETLGQSSAESKLAMWPVALDLATRAPLSGIGRGAFESVYPSYQLDPSPYTFTHPENEAIQLVVELGFPVGLMLLGVLIVTWWRAANSASSRLSMGVLAGLSALAIQNLVDFSLELPGVAVPAALAFGTIAPSGVKFVLSRTMVRALSAVALMLVLGGSVIHARWGAQALDGLVDRALGPEATERAARTAAVWRPADYRAQLVAGIARVREGRCSLGLPWLMRAMRLAPQVAEPHRFAAGCLAQSGQLAPAALEFRLAFGLGDTDAVQSAVQFFPTAQEMRRVVPATPEGLLAAARVLQEPKEAASLYREAADAFGSPGALEGLAQSQLALHDGEAALATARQLQRRFLSPNGFLYAFRALTALGRAGEARAELEAGFERFPGSSELAEPLVQLLASERQFSQAARLIRSVRLTAPGQVEWQALMLSNLLQRQGRLGEALREARRAVEVSPESVRALEALSRALEAAGADGEALDALTRAERIRPGAFGTELARLRAKVQSAGQGPPSP